MKLRKLLSSIKSSIKMDYKKRNRYSRSYINEYAQSLGENGFTVIENFYTAEKCTLILKKIDELLLQNDKSKEYVKTQQGAVINNRGIELTDKDNGMIDVFLLENEIEELLDFKDSDLIRDIINDVSSVKLNSQGVHSYINRGVTNTRCYHADSVYQSQYKAFIYLTDVNEVSDGPYSYVKGTHAFHFIKYYNMFYNLRDKRYNPTDQKFLNSEEVVTFLAKKGTLIISDQNGNHRGLPQKSDKNRAILVHNFAEEPIWGLYNQS